MIARDIAAKAAKDEIEANSGDTFVDCADSAPSLLTLLGNLPPNLLAQTDFGEALLLITKRLAENAVVEKATAIAATQLPTTAEDLDEDIVGMCVDTQKVEDFEAALSAAKEHGTDAERSEARMRAITTFQKQASDARPGVRPDRTARTSPY